LTERRAKLSRLLRLAFIGTIFGFAVLSFLPGDDGLLTESVAQSPSIVQAAE